MRTLLVEDDEMIGRSLRQALEGAGWSVDWVRDGGLAQSALDDGGYACVLLDLGLPERDGTDVLRRARSRGDVTPIVVLTARGGLEDRIDALDLGADDYLQKPFAFRELTARMRAVVRRRVEAALSKMTEGDRTVFVLFEMEGVPGKRIAEIMDCPEASVWRRLHGARQVFRRALEAEGEFS